MRCIERALIQYVKRGNLDTERDTHGRRRCENAQGEDSYVAGPGVYTPRTPRTASKHQQLDEARKDSLLKPAEMRCCWLHLDFVSDLQNHETVSPVVLGHSRTFQCFVMAAPGNWWRRDNMCIFPTVQNRRWFLLSGEEFVNMYQKS